MIYKFFSNTSHEYNSEILKTVNSDVIFCKETGIPPMHNMSENMCVRIRINNEITLASTVYCVVRSAQRFAAL